MQKSEIVSACKALSIAYARHVDFGEYEKFSELFAEDGCLELAFSLDGKAAIRRAIAKRPEELRSRHVLTNIFIDVVSETEATGVSYLTLYRHVGPESLGAGPVELRGPAAVGHYADRFLHTAQGWRIAHRKLHMAFQDDTFFE